MKSPRDSRSLGNPRFAVPSPLEPDALQFSAMGLAIISLVILTLMIPSSGPEMIPSSGPAVAPSGSSGNAFLSNVPARAASPALVAMAPIEIDLNSASSSELSLLPGIGDKMAEDLIQMRDRLGGFRSWQDVQSISGMGPATIATIQPWCKSLTVFNAESMVTSAESAPVLASDVFHEPPSSRPTSHVSRPTRSRPYPSTTPLVRNSREQSDGPGRR